MPDATSPEPPLIVFMHIAKTAGSLVNHVATETLGPSRVLVHCERIPAPVRARQTATREGRHYLSQRRFISGHIYLQEWLRIQGTLLRKLALFTIVRDPIAQLVSHLQWLDHYNLPNFAAQLREMDEATQDVIRRLAAVDFADVGSLDAFLSDLPPRGIQYLDNCQSRYFLAAAPSGEARFAHRREALTLNLRRQVWQQTRHFACIGLQDNLTPFMEQLRKTTGATELRRSRDSINAAIVRRRIPLDPLVRQVLGKRVLLDQWLYQAVRAEARLTGGALIPSAGPGVRD